MDKETSFYILSKPYAISFRCPHCGNTQEIKWSALDVPDYWGDAWGEVECPECGEPVTLGDWEYD